MRFRISRKLPVLVKAGCLLWLLWLGYLLLEHSSFPPNSSGEEDEEAHQLLARRLSLEETESDGRLARPLYVKPPPDTNAPGEWGRAARLNLSPDEKKQEEESIERYAINIFVSDKISVHRHIQDHRMNEWVKQTGNNQWENDRNYLGHVLLRNIWPEMLHLSDSDAETVSGIKRLRSARGAGSQVQR